MNGNDEGLPLDPDLDAAETASGAPRPIHLRPSALLLVFAGGTVGTAAREALSLAFPAVGGIPYAIFAINVVGALLLGVLLESLVRRGTDRGRRRQVRLLVGTGMMGGFTTYSALAADTARLVGTGSAVPGLAYGVGTVLIGAAATWAGIAIGSAVHRRTRSASGEVDR